MRWNTINSRDDEDFRVLLARWDAPQISSELDERVIASFRRVSQKEDALPNHVSFLQTEVITMKQCPDCKETFSAMFVFCPIDSALLVDEAEINKEPQFDFIISENETLTVPSTGAYHVTMMNDAGLVSRLVKEIRATAKQIRLAIPEIKQDPVGFVKRTTSDFSQAVFRFVTSPNVAASFVIALVFMISTVVGIAMLDRYRLSMVAKDDVSKDYEVKILDIPKVEEQKEGSAGTAKGNGGGSGEKDKPHGGGGGGREEEKEASFGKPPMATDNPPLKTPEAVPPPLTKNPLIVKPTIQGDAVILPEDTRPIPYGVDDSASLDPSNGSGKGDGQGDGKGAGNGNGNGNGKGPGEESNTGGDKPQKGCCGHGGDKGQNINYDGVFRLPDVSQRARIIFNPQPQYTEEARKNQVQGVVRLAMVLTASGQIQSIRVASGLPDGLTDKAIEAARRIKFIPAQKDGRNVSQYVTVEYNFRIY